jgi:hypothetical protein
MSLENRRLILTRQQNRLCTRKREYFYYGVSGVRIKDIRIVRGCFFSIKLFCHNSQIFIHSASTTIIIERKRYFDGSKLHVQSRNSLRR